DAAGSEFFFVVCGLWTLACAVGDAFYGNALRIQILTIFRRICENVLRESIFDRVSARWLAKFINYRVCARRSLGPTCRPRNRCEQLSPESSTFRYPLRYGCPPF
ncbi:MAG TPA: hypothetical protein VIS99_00125, partial [Terrimicrobiaceae bacterium]